MRYVVRNDLVIEHYLHRAWLAAGGARKAGGGARVAKSASSSPSILRDDAAVALLVKSARERETERARLHRPMVELDNLGQPMAKGANPIAGFMHALNEARRTPIKPGFGFGNGSGQ
jgi:hypothetical protein